MKWRGTRGSKNIEGPRRWSGDWWHFGYFAAAYVVAHEVAHHVQEERLGVIEGGDIREVINAAKQIGDDTLQRNAGQRPIPHRFTHGTSEQRQQWFARGYKSAKMNQCDTFAALN